ncbi:hypothetical protein HK102_006821, partial [Quaeritorhiza haematococci]
LSPFAILPTNAFRSIARNLDSEDRFNMLLVSRAWSSAAAEVLYSTPPLKTPQQFEYLLNLVTTEDAVHPYGSLVTDLEFRGEMVDELYMGDLDRALQHCPNLVGFRLESCLHISNLVVQSLAEFCPGLKRLALPGCPISDAFIPQLTESCHNLEAVDFSYTNMTLESLPTLLEQCDMLQSLDLSGVGDASPLHIANLDLSPESFELPCMKRITLRNIESLTDDHIRYIVSHCPRLEILQLDSCPLLTDDAVSRIAQWCPKLVLLDVSFNTQLTDLALQALAIHAAGRVVEDLRFSGCIHLTPRGVGLVAQKCGKLKRLLLHGCSRVLEDKAVMECAVPSMEGSQECALNAEGLRKLGEHVSDQSKQQREQQQQQKMGGMVGGSRADGSGGSASSAGKSALAGGTGGSRPRKDSVRVLKKAVAFAAATVDNEEEDGEIDPKKRQVKRLMRKSRSFAALSSR